MRLRGLLLLISALLSVIVLTLAGTVLSGEWSRARHASEGREAIERLQQALVVAEMASRERGPVVALFGAAPADEAAVRTRLATFRTRADAAFDVLERDLDRAGGRRDALHAEIVEVRHALNRARAAVNEAARPPLAQRDPARLREAIGAMFSVIDQLGPPVTALMNEAQAAYPNTTDLLIGARYAADLRELAGQVGSHLTVALARQQALPPEEVLAIEQLRGRIDQLHKLLWLRIERGRDRAAVQQAMTQMDRRYFESAVPFTKQVENAGISGKPYGIDSVKFVARYVPDMDSIVHLRDVELGDALELANLGEQQARRRLLLMSLGSLAMLLVLAAILVLIQRRVLRPMHETLDLLSALARGEVDRSVPTPRHQDELSDVLQAIAVLRDHARARRDLELERQSLIDQLRDQSNTDVLTGLANRRGFLAQSAHMLPNVQRHQDALAVLLFDIDHFKQINDGYGHAAGDTVLVAIADLCRDLCRSSDVVARYGGEEFVVLMPNTSLDGAVVHAERLRSGIEAMRIVQPDGTVTRVTASFGVVQCVPGDLDLSETVQRADVLLYEAKRQGRNRVRFRSAGPEGPRPALSSVR